MEAITKSLAAFVTTTSTLTGTAVDRVGGSLVTSKGLKLVGSTVFALLVGAVLICVLVRVGDLLAVTSTALGLATGWLVGVLAAPYPSEQQRFRKYAGLVSGFLAGFVVSKVESLFEFWLDPAYGPLLLNPIVAQRLMLGTTAFLLAAVSTYVSRKYVSFGPGSEQPPQTA